jgi:hypothetical protein
VKIKFCFHIQSTPLLAVYNNFVQPGWRPFIPKVPSILYVLQCLLQDVKLTDKWLSAFGCLFRVTHTLEHRMEPNVIAVTRTEIMALA